DEHARQECLRRPGRPPPGGEHTKETRCSLFCRSAFTRCVAVQRASRPPSTPGPSRIFTRRIMPQAIAASDAKARNETGRKPAVSILTSTDTQSTEGVMHSNGAGKERRDCGMLPGARRTSRHWSAPRAGPEARVEVRAAR